MSQNQSCTLVFDGINWWSLGYGQNVISNFADGSVEKPSITFVADLTTGLYRNAGGGVSISIKGNDVADFDSGLITLNTPLNLTSPLELIFGGTGLDAVNAGDLLVGAANNTLTALGKGMPGNLLTIDGSGNLDWSSPVLISQGGTGLDAVNAGDLLVGAANNTLIKLGKGIPNSLLTINGVGDISWSLPVLTSQGGTGQVTPAAAFTALAPTAVGPGSIIYWSGSAWIVLPGPTGAPKTLKSTSAGALVWV